MEAYLEKLRRAMKSDYSNEAPEEMTINHMTSKLIYR